MSLNFDKIREIYNAKQEAVTGLKFTPELKQQCIDKIHAVLEKPEDVEWQFNLASSSFFVDIPVGNMARPFESEGDRWAAVAFYEEIFEEFSEYLASGIKMENVFQRFYPVDYSATWADDRFLAESIRITVSP
ncbi:MAG: hypothetical protein CMF60_02100 [Magnetococcales bacterium]|nr:hypothetical protein [Magnetococcales bacterium]|tara:strand:+ start:30913 stop:31311 length:399 start_codon:yes stop_codon:yes gene_type:complete